MFTKMADITDPDVGTAYYRSKDPIKSLKIRITLEQMTASSGFNILSDFERKQDQNQPTQAYRNAEEYIFSWQEKVFSKREREFYSDEKNCYNFLQKKYHQQIQTLMRQGKCTNRLFSYVDHDNFTGLDEDVHYMTTSPNEIPTFLAKKMAKVRQRRTRGRKLHVDEKDFIPKMNLVDLDPSEDMKTYNHILCTPVQNMYIMADLSPADNFPTLADEHILCFVQIDSNGVVAIRPDFNNGPKPYIVESGGIGRVVYEYRIEHLSNKMSRMEQDRERKMYRELYLRHAECLQKCVGHAFELPPPNVLRFVVYGEIESAKNFDYDDLYMHFFLDLPKYWYTEKTQQLSWVTQTCSTKVEDQDDVAYFGFPFSFELFYRKDYFEESERDHLSDFPSLLIEVLSLDSWQRYRTEGYTHLILPGKPGMHREILHCWRPTGGSLVAELRRFFIGGSPELEDPTYTTRPSTFEGSNLSKFGFRTETTGTVTVKLNVIMQSRAFIYKSTGKKTFTTLLESLGISAVQANINEVLVSFKKAREKMLQARDLATLEILKDLEKKEQ